MNWQVSTPNQPNSLYNQGSTSGSPSAFNVAANSTSNPVTLLNVASYASYDLSMYIGDPNQSITGHAHAVKVEFRWYDDNTSGLPVFIEDWYCWVGAQVPMTNPQGAIIATGPMHGQYLSIYIYNAANAAVEVQWMTLYGSPRTINVSDWRQNIAIPLVNDSVLHVGNNQIGTGYDNTVLDYNVTLTANQNYLIPLNMYSGPVYLSYQVTQTIIGIFIADLGINYTTWTSGNIPTSPAGGQVWVPQTGGGSGGLAAGAYDIPGILLPRSACALVIKWGTTTGVLDIKITAQQGP
jgi:hypothetical protein